MWRSSLVLVLIVIWAFAIIGKLYYWQIYSYKKLAAQADEQHFTSLKLSANRGSIFASDGTILVTNQPAFLVYAEPNKILDQSDYSVSLSKLLEIPQSSVSAKISDKNNLWVQLKRKVDEETVSKIQELKLTGVGFEKEGKRYYPEASMSAHLLGFVAVDSRGDDKGFFGIEGFYDKELKGRNGLLRQEKDPFGAPILIGEAEKIDAENGRSLKLHLNKTVQLIVEDKLKKGIDKFGAKGGSIIVMDPQNGGILAMASLPSYSPAEYYKQDDSYYKNPAVANSYEPGSTFKAIIMAAALNESAISPKTEINEDGPVNIAGYQIRTWDNQYHGKINMTQVLQLSSNVGMVNVSSKLGKSKIIEYIKKFGFGSLTNIDLEEEISPNLRSDYQWKEIDLATASFGQGIAVTPIQMVTAMSAIANGGKLMEPHLTAEIIEQSGKVIPIRPKTVRQVIKKSTAKLLTQMLVASVEGGEAHYSVPNGYKIAGKTGTAQIPVSGHYDQDKTIASFIGFAPADRAKFVMIVTLLEPTSSPWGSETAAPLFMDISKDLLSYYKVFPKP